MPVCARDQANLSARADRLDGEAGARCLRPADAGTITVHHELEIEQPPSRVKPADRVAAAHDGAVVAHDCQGNVLGSGIDPFVPENATGTFAPPVWMNPRDTC